MIDYLVAECWSARMIVSRHEVRLSVRDREVSQRVFKSARSYLGNGHNTSVNVETVSMNLVSISCYLSAAANRWGVSLVLGRGEP